MLKQGHSVRQHVGDQCATGHRNETQEIIFFSFFADNAQTWRESYSERRE
jgi:hypothetical protein